MLRLSFIVPFYNVEPYIEECIRSLYNQDISMEEYEVICVDDCSPDGSRAIVERLQKEYPTLKLLIHTENKRQGGARNTGMKVAQGRYIWFVDSDDYIKPNCLKELLQQAETEELDILRIYYSENGENAKGMISYGPCSGSELIFDAPMHLTPDQRCSCVCAGLISRALLIDNKIWFTEHVQFEDDDYAYLFYAYAKKTQIVPITAYLVRERMESTTRNTYSFQTIEYLVLQVRRIIEKEKVLKSIDGRWTDLITHSVSWTCCEQILKHLRELSRENVLRFYLKGMGRIPGLRNFVSRRVWWAMTSLICYKLLF